MIWLETGQDTEEVKRHVHRLSSFILFSRPIIRFPASVDCSDCFLCGRVGARALLPVCLNSFPRVSRERKTFEAIKESNTRASWCAIHAFNKTTLRFGENLVENVFHVKPFSPQVSGNVLLNMANQRFSFLQNYTCVSMVLKKCFPRGVILQSYRLNLLH